MLLSHSPPVFSHSPPTDFLPHNHQHYQSSFRDVPKIRRTTSFPSRCSSKSFSRPSKPILIMRTPEETSSDDDNLSPTKNKKKVVFADDKGMSLTHVRLMTEPSNVPPLWTKRFLFEVTRGISADPVKMDMNWEIAFPQPASDYIHFRQRLEAQNVCLENVLIKENETQIFGTIKVANLSFEKVIFVRSSSDDWTTHKDTTCSYVANTLPSSSSSATSAYVVFDTFTFNMDLPTKSKRLEFCICFKCNQNEYWDNNNNKNYLLLKRIHFLPRTNSNDSFLKSQNLIPKNSNHDPYLGSSGNTNTWSDFASWTYFENSGPYW